MKISRLSLIIIAIVLAIAMFTNPNLAAHKEAVKTKLNAYIQKAIKEDAKNEDSGTAGQALGTLISGAIIDKMVDNAVSTDNYIIFSTTKINWEGESRTIGIGAFGNVFLSSKINHEIAKTAVDDQ